MPNVAFADEPVYQAAQAEDGTWSITDVPVFYLGDHKGLKYDAAWANKTVANFNALAAKGYKPPITKGHTQEGGPELPAVGLVESIKLSGEALLASLMKIPDVVFEEIKQGAWPYRSATVSQEKSIFASLSLLGETPPYFKTPPLAVKFCEQFAEDFGMVNDLQMANLYGTTTTIASAISAQKRERVIEEKLDKVRDAWWAFQDLMRATMTEKSLTSEDKQGRMQALISEFQSIIEQAKPEITAMMSAKAEGETKMAENTFLGRFSDDDRVALSAWVETVVTEKTGGLESQIAAITVERDEARQKFTDGQAALTQLEESRRIEAVEHFADEAKRGLIPGMTDEKHHFRFAVAPAIVDLFPFKDLALSANGTMVKFADKETPIAQAIMNAFAETVKAAVAGTLLVRLGETETENEQFSDPHLPASGQGTEKTVDDRITEKIVALAAGEGVKYEDLKKNYVQFSGYRRKAMTELGLNTRE